MASACLAIALSPGPCRAGSPQIVVSVEDGKPTRSGDAIAPVIADSLTVFEVVDGRLERRASLAVPASMSGPPESVKLTHDGAFAIVSAAQRRLNDTTPTLVADDTVSLVDVSDRRHPRLVQTVRAAAGAMGVAINPQGTVVLVADRMADQVSVFSLKDGRLTARPAVALPKGSLPVAIRFALGGRIAAVSTGSGQLFEISIARNRIRATGRSIGIGANGGSLAMAPGERFAYVANPAGSGPAPADGVPVSAIAMVDLKRFRVMGRQEIGRGVEHIVLSPRGHYLAATLLNGSNLDPSAAGYRPRGLLSVFRAVGGALAPLASIETGSLCQGAVWSQDERRIFLQCAGSRDIVAYGLDGARLVPDPATAFSFASRPAAMATTGMR